MKRFIRFPGGNVVDVESPEPTKTVMDLETIARWIVFREVPAPGVTGRWEIVTKKGRVVIGRIAWSNGWRRYVLQPGYPTEWEQDCLRDVASFLETQTAARKAAR